MGDYFQKTFRKCLLGTVDALVRGKELSPTTQENCAVAAREAEKFAAKNKDTFQSAPRGRLLRLRPPRAYPNIYRNEMILKRTYRPRELREKIDRILESLSPEQREQLMKQLHKSPRAKEILKAPKH